MVNYRLLRLFAFLGPIVAGLSFLPFREDPFVLKLKTAICAIGTSLSVFILSFRSSSPLSYPAPRWVTEGTERKLIFFRIPELARQELFALSVMILSWFLSEILFWAMVVIGWETVSINYLISHAFFFSICFTGFLVLLLVFAWKGVGIILDRKGLFLADRGIRIPWHRVISVKPAGSYNLRIKVRWGFLTLPLFVCLVADVERISQFIDRCLVKYHEGKLTDREIEYEFWKIFVK